MNLSFKIENGNLYWSHNGALKRLDNDSYLTASKLLNGLMSKDHVRQLEETHKADITSANLDNGYLTLTKRDGTNLISNIQVGNNIVPLLRPDDLLLTEGTSVVATDGKYQRSTSANYNQGHLDSFYNKQKSTSYRDSTEAMLSDTSNYSSGESSTNKLFVFHRLQLQDKSNFDSNKRYYLRVKWRFNHADCKFGLLIKKGDSFYRFYEEYSVRNRVVNEDRLYDLSGISGDQIVIFCYSSAWWSFYTDVKLLEHDSVQQINRVGTYTEFERVKNNIPKGATYFITNINNNKGCLAIKTSNTEWRDTLGSVIQNNRHRVTL